MLVGFCAAAVGLMAPLPARCDTVTATNATVYVTKQDCAVLAKHQPRPDVAFQPGMDVHGKPVAPADLQDGPPALMLPDKIQFDITVNPLTYGNNIAGQGTATNRFTQTQLPVAHVAIDPLTGTTSLNGQRLEPQAQRMVGEACRKAGLR